MVTRHQLMPSSKNKLTTQHIHSSQCKLTTDKQRHDEFPLPPDSAIGAATWRPNSCRIQPFVSNQAWPTHATDRLQRSIWRDIIHPRSFYFVLAWTSPKTPSRRVAPWLCIQKLGDALLFTSFTTHSDLFFYSCPAAHSLYSKLLPTARDGFPPMHTIYCSLHLQLNFPGVSGVSTPASFGSSFHLLSGVSNQADFRAQLMLPMQIYLSCSCIWGQTYVRVAATLQK